MSEAFELLPAFRSTQHRYAGKIVSVERGADHIVVTLKDAAIAIGRNKYAPISFVCKPYTMVRSDDDSWIHQPLSVPENPTDPFMFTAHLVRSKYDGQDDKGTVFDCELNETFYGRCALVEGFYVVLYRNDDDRHHFSTCPADVFEKANVLYSSTAESNEQLFADKLVETMTVLDNAHKALNDVTRLLTEQGYTLAAVKASRDVAYANAVQLARNYGYGDAAIAEMSSVGGGHLGELLKHLSGAKDKINPVDRPETQDVVLKAVNAFLSDEALGVEITNSDKDKIRKTVLTNLHKELSRR
jgi:hypothetical protein